MDENEIVSAAQEKARIIEEEAEQRANKRLEQADREAMAKRAEAYNYALQTLQTLERNLDSVLGTVRNGVGMLTPDSDRTAGVR